MHVLYRFTCIVAYNMQRTRQRYSVTAHDTPIHVAHTIYILHRIIIIVYPGTSHTADDTVLYWKEDPAMSEQTA